MAGTSRDISSVMTSAANNYNSRLDSSVRKKIRIRTEVIKMATGAFAVRFLHFIPM